MYDFKEILKQDITNTFLNNNEFSDKHTIDGKEMTVQIDENEALERELRFKANTDGVYKKQKLIYVSEEEFGPLPYEGRWLKFDGKSYRIAAAITEGGIHSITLDANRS